MSVRAVVRRGAFVLDVVLEVRPGEVLAVLGPNGSGKSTLLAVLAGLLVPDLGRVEVRGRVLTSAGEPAPAAPVLVPPADRAVGLLGQDPLLFPHLTAARNIAFGPLAAGTPRRGAEAQAAGWLDAVGLASHADRRPAQLSGGQQQRVALARALAARPDVLLLDEPMASLDVRTAPEMRDLLRAQLAAHRTTTVLVTHDVLDAVVLADRVAVLEDGHLVDVGPTARVLAAPRNPFVADLAGVNLVVGTADGGAVRAPDGRRFVGVEGTDSPPLPDGAPVAAVFRPAAVVVQTAEPHGASPRNVWRASVIGLEAAPTGVRLRTTGDPEVLVDLTPAAVAELGLVPGADVWLSVKASEVGLHRR
ncbi:ATP-binding cassette domain-containing protein [Cellulomonas fimi]|uniref:ATP-binding cassette domain-containing protein n=1 Tax=Cellulomonas fimi TaxID=1708 RepID=A0A7Y0QFX0_CELFI|nr:ATP-binding cassette domain-containing protein [Cellulomonas fimi]